MTLRGTARAVSSPASQQILYVGIYPLICWTSMPAGNVPIQRTDTLRALLNCQWSLKSCSIYLLFTFGFLVFAINYLISRLGGGLKSFLALDFLSVFPTGFFRVGFFWLPGTTFSSLPFCVCLFVDVISICFNKVALWRYIQSIIQ